jgi:predicted metal-dependent phosphoesterase TrpH
VRNALKVELHAHTSHDPVDVIPHSLRQLIDRASALGYDAVAITLHDEQMDLAPFRGYAAEHGLVLIPGVERTIAGKHVLLVNFTRAAESVSTFADLAALKDSEPGLVVAPHPFFPWPNCLGRRLLDRHAALFDAVELNAMHVRGVDFNRPAIAWAAEHGKPLVGNGDVHRLAQLGTTYTLVDADPDPDAICRAILAGRVEIRTVPLGWLRAGAIFADLLTAPLWRRRQGAAHPDRSSRSSAGTAREL